MNQSLKRDYQYKTETLFSRTAEIPDKGAELLSFTDET